MRSRQKSYDGWIHSKDIQASTNVRLQSLMNTQPVRYGCTTGMIVKDVLVAHSAPQKQKSLEGIKSMIGEDVLLEMGEEYLSKVKRRSFTDNCVFGFSLDDGSVVPTRGAYCHGDVMNPYFYLDIRSTKPAAINTRIQKNSTGYDIQFGKTNGGLLPKDYFDEYYDFLFNHSVFADCYVTKSTEGLHDGGVVVVRCDRRANLMAAACVAIRRGWEYTLMSKSLVNMLRMGIEPNLAHLVSYQLSVDEKGNFKGCHYGDHQSVYSCRLDKSGVKNFREGKLPPSNKYNIKTYRELLTYKGLYGMWNDSGEKAVVTGKNSFTLKSDSMKIDSKADPFNFIVKLDLKLPRSILDAIEEGLQTL